MCYVELGLVLIFSSSLSSSLSCSSTSSVSDGIGVDCRDKDGDPGSDTGLWT